MLQISVVNLKVGVRGTPLPATISCGSVLNSLENRGLKLKDIHTYTFMNFTTYMTNGTPEYITLKNNDVCVENILGTYIAGDHSVTVVRANSKAVWVTFYKVPSFILDAELVHFASFYGKVLNERGVIWERSTEPRCKGLDVFSGTRKLEVELPEGASMPGFIWIESIKSTYHCSRITVRHRGKKTKLFQLPGICTGMSGSGPW